MTSNTITIVGNTTNEIELRYGATGNAFASINVAVNRKWRSKDGESQEETSFFTCKLFGQAAENAAESYPKGTRVLVTGRMEQNNWETKEGEKRSKMELVVDEIGASSKWATVTVNKAERTTAQDIRDQNKLNEDAWLASGDPF